jgi:hypothetical protein
MIKKSEFHGSNKGLCPYCRELLNWFGKPQHYKNKYCPMDCNYAKRMILKSRKKFDKKLSDDDRIKLYEDFENHVKED